MPSEASDGGVERAQRAKHDAAAFGSVWLSVGEWGVRRQGRIAMHRYAVLRRGQGRCEADEEPKKKGSEEAIRVFHAALV